MGCASKECGSCKRHRVYCNRQSVLQILSPHISRWHQRMVGNPCQLCHDAVQLMGAVEGLSPAHAVIDLPAHSALCCKASRTNIVPAAALSSEQSLWQPVPHHVTRYWKWPVVTTNSVPFSNTANSTANSTSSAANTSEGTACTTAWWVG